MAKDTIQELYEDTANMLSSEHANAAAEIEQGAVALKAALATRATTEKRSSLLARLFNTNT